MNQGTLDIVITVKGEESILRDIQHKLTDDNADCSDLSNDLATKVYQLLLEAGVTDQIKVNLHCGRAKAKLDTGGGLNVREWYDKN